MKLVKLAPIFRASTRLSLAADYHTDLRLAILLHLCFVCIPDLVFDRPIKSNRFPIRTIVRRHAIPRSSRAYQSCGWFA